MDPFRELYERYYRDVYRFALFLTGDAARAEDLAADTFVRAWTARDRIRHETVRAYLLTIARNLYRDGLQSGRSVKGTVTLTNMPLRELIGNAFGVRLNRVLGGPGWLDSERFDIVARAPANTPDDQMRLMLRALLTHRFKLVVHTATREQPAYALIRACNDGRLGPNLIASSDCDRAAQLHRERRKLASGYRRCHEARDGGTMAVKQSSERGRSLLRVSFVPSTALMTGRCLTARN